MKTAVSIPDDVFELAERFAKRTKKSRSQLFGDALREYMARHSTDEISEKMNRALSEISEKPDELVRHSVRRVLENSEW